jgi:hypothetical protein
MQGIPACYLSTAISAIHGHEEAHGLDRGCVLCLRLHRHHFSPAVSLLPDRTKLVLQHNRPRYYITNFVFRAVTNPEEACSFRTTLLMFQINWVLHFVGSIARTFTRYSWPETGLIPS